MDDAALDNLVNIVAAAFNGKAEDQAAAIAGPAAAVAAAVIGESDEAGRDAPPLVSSLPPSRRIQRLSPLTYPLPPPL